MSCLAEQNIIGSLMIDPSCIGVIHNIVEAEMFQDDLLGWMYLEFVRGYENHYDVNAVVLCQNYANSGFPERIVFEEIKKCTTNTLTSASIKSYASAVVSSFKARKLNKILTNVVPAANNVELQIGKLINDLELLKESKSSTSKTLTKIVQENRDNYFKDNDNEMLCIGFPKLDDMLGGLEGGDMIIIGARPAVGKSAFVTQITTNLASKKKRVGFYNLEMQEKQIYERFVASQSGIGLKRLRRAKHFLGDEEKKFNLANETLAGRENIVITTGSKTMSEIRSESRHMGYDIIIIDYLQLLKPDTVYRGNRTAEVGAISKAIKSLAMELNIPIIALSQLNRVSEMKDTKEPTMSELREAGDIEQDASIIILMWNLSQQDKSKKGCKAEKNRQGEPGTVVMNFNGNLMRFEELNESVSDAREWGNVKDDDCPFK